MTSHFPQKWNKTYLSSQIQEYFKQDGAPPHTAKNTVKHIIGRSNLLNHWPANSPDLNPIEHVWGIMKARLRCYQPKDREEMIGCLLTVWESIDQEVLDRLVQSFRYRLHLMLLHGGLSIGPFLRHGHNDEPVVFPSPGGTQLYRDLVLGPSPDGLDD